MIFQWRHSSDNFHGRQRSKVLCSGVAAWKELKAAEKDYERLHGQAEEVRDAESGGWDTLVQFFHGEHEAFEHWMEWFCSIIFGQNQVVEGKTTGNSIAWWEEIMGSIVFFGLTIYWQEAAKRFKKEVRGDQTTKVVDLLFFLPPVQSFSMGRSARLLLRRLVCGRKPCTSRQGADPWKIRKGGGKPLPLVNIKIACRCSFLEKGFYD